MHDILVDFTYYQGTRKFNGGGEYGNVVLEELLKQPEQINCGIFFWKGRRIDKHMLGKCQDAGWRIHPICDTRNVSSIVKEYHYTTIYSALPYYKRSKTNMPDNVQFIATFHGLRSIELSDCERNERYFCEQGEILDRPYYIYGLEDKERRIKNRIPYNNALSAFKKYKIIVVSEHTKHSIYYHYPELINANIEVLYSPPKLVDLVEPFNDKSILAEYGLLPKNFGLIVSAGIWHKNGRRALLAYDRVFERQYEFIRPDFKVVVLGVKNEQEMLNGIIHKERFMVLDYVEAGHLEVLYRNAQLFVYPSLNEGFGYPPLEAMKYGTLCACSANTSISEICRDMALYFNPLLIDEIAIRILESFSDNIRAEKEERMKQQLPIIQNRQKVDLQKLIKIITGEA